MDSKYFIKRMFNNTKTGYILSVGIMCLILIVGYFSFALFTSDSEKRGALNIEVGNLHSLIESPEFNEAKQVIVPAGATKEFTIKLMNTNNISAKFNLYYSSANDLSQVEIGYLSANDAPPDKNGYAIEKYGSGTETKIISVKVINKGENEVAIDFGSNAGLANKPLVFPEGMNVLGLLEEHSLSIANGTPIYFNPETNKTCSQADYNANSGASDTGNKSGCMKWYAFNSNNTDSMANLILDHDTTGAVAWNSTGPNSSMGEVATQLSSDVSGWHLSVKSTTRLISANEIAAITGHPTFDSTKTGQASFNFETNTSTASPICQSGSTSGCSYGWLYDRTSSSCTTYGCLNNATGSVSSEKRGYWTSSPDVSGTTYVWYVADSASLYTDGRSNSRYGVRPVITVEKADIEISAPPITDGTTKYFNPETNLKCSQADYNANSGASDIGNKSGCMKWYSFNSNNTDSMVNLILDHDTTGTVAWNSTGPNSSMGEVATQLSSDVSGWHLSVKSTTRLISANEIAAITGHPTFDSTKTGQAGFNFDTNTLTASSTCQSGNTSGCSYGWLYDRTSSNCTTYGCLNNATGSVSSEKRGYWTSSPDVSGTTYVWYVADSGSLYTDGRSGSRYGVRPVITVSKSKI